MSSFSDAVNMNKYSNVQQILRFALLKQFLSVKVRSLSCQYHSLTKYLNDEEVYSVLSGLSFSKDSMEVLNRCWKWSFINNFETEIKLKSTYRAPPLNLIFLMILKLEQAQRRIFCQHFNVEVLLKINITLIEAWDVVKSENVLLDPNSEL